MKTSDDIIWFVHSENGKPVGICGFNKVHEEIVSILVDNNFRRKGIATKLIKEIEVWAKENGYKRIFGTVKLENDASNGVFEKLGYEKLNKYEIKF